MVEFKLNLHEPNHNVAQVLFPKSKALTDIQYPLDEANSVNGLIETIEKYAAGQLELDN